MTSTPLTDAPPRQLSSRQLSFRAKTAKRPESRNRNHLERGISLPGRARFLDFAAFGGSARNDNRHPSNLALGAAFAAVYLFWGVTFLAIRYAVLDGVPPLIVIGVRCLFGAAILYAWLAVQGNWRPTSLAQWRTAGIAGVLLFVGGHSAMAWAEQWVDSGETALLMTTIPLWLVVLTAAVQRRAPSRRVMAGLGLGIAGVAVLTLDTGTWNGSALPRVVLLGCALAWAVGSIIARDGARPASAVQSTTMQLAVGAVVVTLLALATGDLGRWDPSTLTPRAVWSLAFLVIGGTVLGFAAYTWLLQVTTPAAVGTYAFVNPIVAVALAAALGDMEITFGTAVAAVLVLSSVALTRPVKGAHRRVGGGKE